MEERHLVELHEKEKTYWWNTNKRMMIRALLARHAPGRGRLLDIGSGGGELVSLLHHDGWRVTTCDISAETMQFARARGIDAAVVLDATQPWPLLRDSFDAVLLLDVIEHLEDDAACLREAHAALRPGAIAIVTAPAHQALFSRWDKTFGHERRYSKRGFVSVLEAAGFDAIKVTYWNALMLLPAAAIRGKDRLLGIEKEAEQFPYIPRVLNEALKSWGRVESWLVARTGLPCGLSLVAVLRKA